MADCSTKKKPTNLKLIQIINSQKINDIKVLDLDISKSHKPKPHPQKPHPTVKGKKIDNKILKIRKRKENEQDEGGGINPVQMTNYNTNTESVSVIDTLPWRDRERERERQNRSRNDFSQGTHSICTFDVNEQIEKGKKLSHNRRASDVVKVSWNKENSRSHSRNSLGFDQRRMSYARKIHNRSCNEMEGKQSQSRGQSRERGGGKYQHHYVSCNDGGQRASITPERRKKDKEKEKERSAKKSKKSSSQVTKNPTVKDINFKKIKIQAKKKPIDSNPPKPIKKKQKSKQKQKQPTTKPHPKKQTRSAHALHPLPSHPNSHHQSRQKRSIDIKQTSDPEQPQYPVSKYVSQRRRPSSELISQNLTVRNTLYQRMLSSSSLIRTIETSKKQSQSQLIDTDIQFIEIGETSLNLREIRKYEEINKVSGERLREGRRRLYPNIVEVYPELNGEEVEFLSCVILVQRWWRERRRRRVEEEEPDQNLTEIIKGILGNAIRSQEVSPSGELVEGKKGGGRNEGGERRKFFRENEGSVVQVPVVPPPSRQAKELNSSFDSYDLNIGDLDIPQSRIKQSLPHLYPKTLQSQLFPPFALLQHTRNDILKTYTSKIDQLSKQTSFQTTHQQHLLKQQMRRDLKKLDKDNRTIQKGYLTYLNCLQNIKTRPKSKSLLRKVSSSEGLMFELYKKTWGMEEGIQESDSVEELARKVLIRKEWVGEGKGKGGSGGGNSPLVHFGSDPSSPVHLSFLNNLGKKEKLDDFIGRSAENIKPKKPTSYKPPHDNNNNSILSLNEILNEYRNNNYHSEEVSEDYQSEIMANLLDEQGEGIGEEDEIKVNEVIDMVLELIYLEYAEDIEEMPRVKEKFLSFLENRHIPGIDCSDSAIKYYLNIVIQQFLSSQKPSLVQCLNTPIGFSSLSILKLMRQPQFSPPDKYLPPVDPKSFQTIQTLYFNRIDLPTIYKKNTTLVSQLINIHNKAIYQCFLSQLQQLKPNGENGIIHPWDAPRLINHSPVSPEQIYFKLTETVGRVMKHCSYKAGLILENWVTRNARELEKAYEENEERVVAMITGDLEEEEGRWKDVDEFLLEVRLDVEVLVVGWVVEEVAREVREMRGRGRGR